jgi:hypothetical protein
MSAEQMANASGNGGQDQGVNVAVLEPPADGISIAQLNQNYAEHAGQEVTIRGTVVKATPGILGTNWYHLQDGSAAGAAGDVIVTSNEQIPRGGIVTVSGIVEINNEKREFMQHDFIVKAKSISNEQSSPDKELP